MSRLAKTVVTEREEFVRNLFRETPTLTGKVVQGKLKDRFGKMMSPKRVAELKREVLSAPVTTETAETADDNVNFSEMFEYTTSPVVTPTENPDEELGSSEVFTASSPESITVTTNN